MALLMEPNQFVPERGADPMAGGRRLSKKRNSALRRNWKSPCFVLLLLRMKKSAVKLYVESGNISVKGKSRSRVNLISVVPNRTRNSKNLLDDFTPIAQQLNNMALVINGTMPGQQRDSLMNVYTMQQSLQSEIDKFVNNKPASFVSVFYSECHLPGAHEDIVQTGGQICKIE